LNIKPLVQDRRVPLHLYRKPSILASSDIRTDSSVRRPPPQRRSTLGNLSLRRSTRHATGHFPRNEAAAAEEGNSLDRFALTNRRHTSLTTATEVVGPDSPPPKGGRGQNASPSGGRGVIPLPVLTETSSRASQ
jgi:hypothetical protein